MASVWRGEKNAEFKEFLASESAKKEALLQIDENLWTFKPDNTNIAHF